MAVGGTPTKAEWYVHEPRRNSLAKDAIMPYSIESGRL